MLNDCLEVFVKQFNEKGESLILDNYKPSQGTYILVNEDGSIDEILDISHKDFNRVVAKDFIILDYHSKLLDMNKAIDSKKIVHSNNFLSFWVKKESFTNGKLNEEAIDRYFDTLANIESKYNKNAKSKALYNQVKEELGDINLVKLECNRNWIKDNIFTLVEKHNITLDKTYLKIFFKADLKEYIKENKRYVLPNIYNSTDYNITTPDGDILGLPNNNYSLDSKKLFIKTLTRKTQTPYLINLNDIMIHKKFFDYINTLASNNMYNLYIGDNEILALDNNSLPDKDFSGIYLRIDKSKNETAILEQDYICSYTPDIIDFDLQPIIDIDAKVISKLKNLMEYGPVNKIENVSKLVNSKFFKGKLTRSYFLDAKDIDLKDSADAKIKRELLRTREAFFNWFFKGSISSIKPIFADSSLNLIKNSIFNNNTITAIEQFNLRDAIITYLGGEGMGNKISEIKSSIINNILSNSDGEIKNDEEFNFLAGQLSTYLLNLSKSSNKNLSLLNGVFASKSVDALKKELNTMFLRYNHAIKDENIRFKKLYALICAYEPKNNIVNTDMLIAGSLSSNILYLTREDIENVK